NSSTSLELSWGRAANSLNYQLQLQQLFRSNAGVSALPLLFPQAVQADYVPWFVFRGPNGTGRTGNAGQYQTDRGPFTNKNVTLDYGVRFYYLSPQWDTTLQASNFLPDKFNPNAAALLYTPVCVGGAPGAGCIRRGMDPTLIAQGVAPTLTNTVEERFIGRLT